MASGKSSASALRQAVALRHVAYEDLGLLAQILRSEGWDTSYCESANDDLGAPAIEAADLLIVLGGPFGAYETETYPFLAEEIAILERRLARKRPTLGICLGAQLMAKALGARVFPGPVREVGWGRVELTAQGRQSCLYPLAEDGAKVVHWHGDTFDLPSGAARLASNDNYQNQAFAFGDEALALQFHLEADAATLEKWYVGYAIDLPPDEMSVAEFRAQTKDAAPQAGPRAAKIFSAWLRDIGNNGPLRSE
jgi:GMP synthase (glutamine-hydrolysing)